MCKLIYFIYKIFVRLLKIDHYYKSRIHNSNKWVYISYIPEVFYNLWNKNYIRGHQSRQEMVEIVRIINDLGYNVYVSSYKNTSLPNYKFDLIFGIEPSFVKACNAYPEAKKIYYATGSYFEFQNSEIKKRTDEFNKQHLSNIPYRRIVQVNDHIDIADEILQIGSNFTIETYPEIYKNKISLIHQSSTLNESIVNSLFYAKENEYIWIGGGGSILKGLDLILDYFIVHTTKKLHVVGNVEVDFLDVYKDKLTNNIQFHGYMNLMSNSFIEIVEKCNFLLYPSCTEGGCPGAVINSMYCGLIPIVSRVAAFDEIENYGYCINNFSDESIHKAIRWSEGLSKEEVLSLKIKCKKFASETYNLERFKCEFKDYISLYLK